MQTFEPIVLKGYAIYAPGRSMWSKGGTNPQWKKTPKVWANLGHLKNHLQQFIVTSYPKTYGGQGKFRMLNTYVGCVVYDITTGHPVQGFDIYTYLNDVCVKKQSKSQYYRDWEIVGP